MFISIIYDGVKFWYVNKPLIIGYTGKQNSLQSEYYLSGVSSVSLFVNTFVPVINL